MFKSSFKSSSVLASRRELLVIHAGQNIKNRFLEGPVGHNRNISQADRLADSDINARAAKLGAILSVVLKKGSAIGVAAARRSQLDELERHGCIRGETMYQSYELGRFVLSHRDDFNMNGHKEKLATERLMPLVEQRVREQYDFASADESLENLLGSSEFRNACATPPRGYSGKPSQMILQWLAERQLQFGSEWLVIVDETSMLRLRPDLIEGGAALIGDGRG